MEKLKYTDMLNESMFINKLSNGLTCYIIPKVGYVEKQAVICTNYGSVDSKFCLNDQMSNMPEGIAHFLEHKIFEDEQRNIFDEFVKQGAQVNAFTNFTNTAYYFNGIEHFYENLALLLDFTSTPYFTEENVEKEKGIIAQEINMYLDNAFWQMTLNMQDAMYEQCPVKHNIAGSVESIMKISKDDLIHCFETFYYAENMALICVGDVENELVYDMAERIIKPSPPKKLMRIYGEEPPTVKTRRVEGRMSLSRPLFSLGFKEHVLSGGMGERMVNTKLLMDIVAGESSDFFNQLYSDGLIDGPFSLEYLCSPFYGTAVFSGSSKHPDQVSELILKQLQKMKTQGIDKERFEQIKNKHIGRFIRGFNNLDVIATGQVDLFSKGIDMLDLMNCYKNCNELRLNERLSQLFGSENNVLSVMQPN